MTPTFFSGRSLPLPGAHYTKKQKESVRGKFNYFSYAIHIGSTWYMDTGVRDLEVAFL